MQSVAGLKEGLEAAYVNGPKARPMPGSHVLVQSFYRIRP